MHDKNLEFLKLKSRFLKRLNNIEEEIKLRNATRKEIDEINILELELEIKQKLSMSEEYETGELLSNLYRKKIDTLDELL